MMAGHDPLHDQGHKYAQQLQAQGVNTKVLSYDSLAHGFTAYMGAVPDARRACIEIAHNVRELYAQQGY
ncbi:MAG: alpha/beta hydrolase fold domain-containing protein [Hyphomonadaceae bacterium]|nr:alpha/beta hydrolase fold domain-containing protein [Hyphomonadaceae bacterium]